MARDFIGVIRNANTGQIYAVINPDDDSEIGNPRLLLLKATEAIEMLRVPRSVYESYGSMDHRLTRILRTLTSHAPDILSQQQALPYLAEAIFSTFPIPAIGGP